MGNKVVALIPARGGSQGISRKNLAEVAGTSLLARAISSCEGVAVVTEICVSSDDEEMLQVAESRGARAVRRPMRISHDSTRANAVVDHFLESHEGSYLSDDDVLLYIQPTSPFRKQHHVDGALQLLLGMENQSVVSVKMLEDYPGKSLLVTEAGILEASPSYEESSANRQELPTLYYPNGAIYAFTVGRYRAVGDFPTIGSTPFLMNKIDSIDIDSAEDLEIARAIASHAGI